MRRKETFLLETIGDGNVLVPLGAQVVDLNGVVVLNTTARYIWEMLAEDRSAEELAAAIVDKFDIDLETARADVEMFAVEIARIGLLEK